jgi:uncharacterized protein involved in exopolysaccharide biosynthesis
MLVFFGSTMGLVVLGLLFFPRTYTSDARLFVRLGKESVGLDPTATVSQTVDVQDTRENEINSEIEILRSRSLMEAVVNKLGPDVILYGGVSEGAGSKLWNALLAPVDVARTWIHGSISPTERAIAELDKTVTVTSPKRSNVILLKAKADSPRQAQAVLQAYVDEYLVIHAKANRTEGSYEFFVDQSKLLADQLKQANDELRDAKNAISLVSVEGQRQSVQSQTSTIEDAILENQRALAHSEAKVAALQEALKNLPAELDAEQTAGLPNVAADAMRNELYKLQIQEKDASSRFTALHPTVIALRRQVEDTKKILDEQKDSRSQTTKKTNPVHQSVQTELTAAQALAAAQRAEAASLEKQYNGIQAKIKTLNDSEFRITDLTRKSELLEASYREYIANREQARIDQALAHGNISNVNIMQAPTFVAKASSPKVLLTLIAGFIVAAGGAVLLAFACDHFDPSLKTPQDIENDLGIPVLFSVPRNDRHALLQN